MKFTQPTRTTKVRAGEYLIQKDFRTYVAVKSDVDGLWNLRDNSTDEWMGAAKTLKKLVRAVELNA